MFLGVEKTVFQKFTGISSFALHLIAMALMLCDHLWATVIPGNMWLTNIGRIAFPIFAFMIVEGYFHTHDLKKYMLRLLAGALISEIPFNLMYGGSVFYPYHQNVMWTLLLSLLCILASEQVRKKHPKLYIPAVIVIFLGGTLLGFACMVDYYGFGVLTVGVFYVFRGRKWWQLLLQAAGLYWVNVKLLGGMIIDVTLFGHTFEVIQQGLALFALIPIWLYMGKQGPHSKAIQYAFYLFYPAHMLVLSLIALNM